MKSEQKKKKSENEDKKNTRGSVGLPPTNLFRHYETIKKLKIDVDKLPPTIKVVLLKMEIYRSQAKSVEWMEGLREESDKISAAIERWHKSSNRNRLAELKKVSPDVILELGSYLVFRVFNIVENTDDSKNFLQTVLAGDGFLQKAKSFAPLLIHSVHRKEYDNNIELVERAAKNKLAGFEMPEVIAQPKSGKFVKQPADTVKKQYEKLLEKNMAGVMAFVEREKDAMMRAVLAYLDLNTTSVFSYSYKNGEITGSIKDMAVLKKPFKI